MSSIRDFLYGIAQEMGRPKESMDPFIKIFDDNWYDTVESIKDLDEDALSKMKLPLRMIEVIRKKLGGSKPQPESTKMEVEEEKKTNITTTTTAPNAGEMTFLNHQLSKVTESLEQLKRETITPQILLEVVNILEKVIGNLVKDPANETFRTLKLTNEKLKEKFFAYRSVLDILSLIGFSNKGEILYIQQNEVNLTLTKQVLKEVESLRAKTQERQSFDPYKASFGTRSDNLNVANIVSQGGPSSYDYVQKLDELKQKRWDAVKSYIEDKEVKVFVLEPNTTLQSFLTTRDQELEEEEDPTSAEYLFKKEILRWAKEFEDSQQFTSRRKKEFEELLKKPLFIESRVRVRFPNNTILEAKFSPKEPVKNVVDLVKKYLVDPTWDFYLYQTPPVQKITQYVWNKSLEDSEMVPNTLLYFGTNQPLEGVQDYLTIKPQKS